MKMTHDWQFLSLHWWLVHLLGFSLLYIAGRLTGVFFKG